MIRFRPLVRYFTFPANRKENPIRKFFKFERNYLYDTTISQEYSLFILSDLLDVLCFEDSGANFRTGQNYHQWLCKGRRQQ